MSYEFKYCLIFGQIHLTWQYPSNSSTHRPETKNIPTGRQAERPIRLVGLAMSAGAGKKAEDNRINKRGEQIETWLYQQKISPLYNRNTS